MTRELAVASGQDAGNASMRRANRSAWNEDDQAVATKTTNRLLLHVPFQSGGLEGLPLSREQLRELNIIGEDEIIHSGGKE